LHELGDLMLMDWIIIKEPLLNWYRDNHRELPWRNTDNPYHIWISEIMLQQTRVEAVKGYYQRFLDRLPDIQSLCLISEDELLKLWEGLGYYNRARNLQKAAKVIMEQYHGEFPKEYEEVVSLPGIGEYTAGAICSICFNQSTPAVDGNVLRVMTRIAKWDAIIDLAKTKTQAKDELMKLYAQGNCNELTQALMELGATVCVPNGVPNCEACPLRGVCQAYTEQDYLSYPKRAPKRKRKIYEKTVFVLHNEDCFGIRQRPDSGVLANMWEFYHTDGYMDKQEALDFISEKGFGPILLEKEIPYTHIFTHMEWKMTAYFIACTKMLSDLTWVTKEELESKYALPTAFKMFLDKEH